MMACSGLPERVRSMEGLGVAEVRRAFLMAQTPFRIIAFFMGRASRSLCRELNWASERGDYKPTTRTLYRLLLV